ncbi:hypothetical protein MMC25_007952 [Agyrium rufum]|nr:hypothetical protein [Agyrium rufum]
MVSMAQPSVEDVEQIGRGSFATVYRHQNFAWKVVRREGVDNGTLLEEYQMLKKLHRKCGLDWTSENIHRFRLPVVQSYYNPLTKDVRVRSWAVREDSIDWFEDFRHNFAAFEMMNAKRAILCMDIIPRLSLHWRERIRDRLFPADLQHRAMPSHCKLYLGLSSPGTAHMAYFAQSSPSLASSSSSTASQLSTCAFPLDLASYAILSGKSSLLPPLPFVAMHMGHMLSALHWSGHNDARGVEWIMGGCATVLGGVNFHVIDFERSQSFRLISIDSLSDSMSSHSGSSIGGPSGAHDDEAHTNVEDDRRKLSEIFVEIFTTLGKPFLEAEEPYYPLARRGDPIYEAFREGYLQRAPEKPGVKRLALIFLRGIEVAQKERDKLDCVDLEALNIHAGSSDKLKPRTEGASKAHKTGTTKSKKLEEKDGSEDMVVGKQQTSMSKHVSELSQPTEEKPGQASRSVRQRKKHIASSEESSEDESDGDADEDGESD